MILCIATERNQGDGVQRLDDHIDIAYWRRGRGCCFSRGSAFSMACMESFLDIPLFLTGWELKD